VQEHSSPYEPCIRHHNWFKTFYLLTWGAVNLDYKELQQTHNLIVPKLWCSCKMSRLDSIHQTWLLSKPKTNLEVLKFWLICRHNSHPKETIRLIFIRWEKNLEIFFGNIQALICYIYSNCKITGPTRQMMLAG